MSRLLDDYSFRSSNNPNHETLRNNCVPLKVEVFIWRLIRRRLPVRVKLDKRGIDLHSVRCPLCDDDIESLDHAFIFCKQAMEVWERVYKWWGFGGVSNLSINEAFRGKSQAPLSPVSSKLWQAVEWTSAYLIWWNRNQKVFSNNSWTGASALLEIQLKSYDWISKRFKKKKIDWFDWLANPCSCV
ncbi:uncharacterized protein [Rutidosis leptorrhynchoides]|uniref:uncharacterized protein n=1 Tax=Rutidosis leptorrhynchoides TaxID=125765 RepID=UPI003A998605